tara:strand:- start:112 stop:417 length:306 start_codon:yes stop_codon:yes gene_type:complete
MNSLSLILLVIGLLLIMIGYFQYTSTLIKNKKVEYRYIPRKLLDEQFDETRAGKIGEVFRNMFNDKCASTWGALQNNECREIEVASQKNIAFSNPLLVEAI